MRLRRGGADLPALRQVVAASRKAGKIAGINPGTMEHAREWLRLGFRAISWSNDIAVYRGAGAQPERIPVTGGFAEVSDKGLTVLAESAGA